MNDQDIINALKLVSDKYKRPLAIVIERIFRNETGHFKSGNFKITLSPGMEVSGKSIAPYGWTSLAGYWKDNIKHAPSGTYTQKENSSAMGKSLGNKTFIVFSNIEASIMSVAFLINLRGGDGGRWFSNNDSSEGEIVRKKYNDVLNGIIPRFCNTLK